MSSRFGTRLDRANELAATGQIVKSGNAWLVPSQSNPDTIYKVEFKNDELTCTCPDYQRRHAACKHILSAAKVAQQQAAESAA